MLVTEAAEALPLDSKYSITSGKNYLDTLHGSTYRNSSDERGHELTADERQKAEEMDAVILQWQ